MKAPSVMGSIFWGLIAFAVAVVAFGIFRSQENAARPRYDVQPQVATTHANTGPLLSPAPFFDFGNISMAAGTVSHRFSIRNTGDSAVTINKMYTSCMCTVATLITPAGRKGPFGMPGHGVIPAIFETIPPGGSAQVDVVFDPAAHGPAGVGPTDRVVTIRSNESPPLALRFTAMVKP
ncbi:MAG: DUF1573 domain-containing protein [Betaproteobacteria bacterium]|nr:DUF1573 domain-containing protein [Betaproteobacteria bacterium]